MAKKKINFSDLSEWDDDAIWIMYQWANNAVLSPVMGFNQERINAIYAETERRFGASRTKE